MRTAAVVPADVKDVGVSGHAAVPQRAYGPAPAWPLSPVGDASGAAAASIEVEKFFLRQPPWTTGPAPHGLNTAAEPCSLCSAHVPTVPSKRPTLPATCPRPPALTQATALATIGKFVVKKKVGENDAIFGSVTAQELVDAIRMQVGHVSGSALASQRVNAAGRGAPRAGVLQWRRLRCAGSSGVEHARGAGPAPGRCWQAACSAGMTARMAAVAALLVLAMSWQLLLCQRKNGQSSGQKAAVGLCTKGLDCPGADPGALAGDVAQRHRRLLAGCQPCLAPAGIRPVQTGRELDRKAVTLPEIKTLGTYDASSEPPAQQRSLPACVLPACSSAWRASLRPAKYVPLHGTWHMVRCVAGSPPWCRWVLLPTCDCAPAPLPPLAAQSSCTPRSLASSRQASCCVFCGQSACLCTACHQSSHSSAFYSH